MVMAGCEPPCGYNAALEDSLSTVPGGLTLWSDTTAELSAKKDVDINSEEVLTLRSGGCEGMPCQDSAPASAPKSALELSHSAGGAATLSAEKKVEIKACCSSSDPSSIDLCANNITAGGSDGCDPSTIFLHGNVVQIQAQLPSTEAVPGAVNGSASPGANKGQRVVAGQVGSTEHPPQGVAVMPLMDTNGPKTESWVYTSNVAQVLRDATAGPPTTGPFRELTNASGRVPYPTVFPRTWARAASSPLPGPPENFGAHNVYYKVYNLTPIGSLALVQFATARDVPFGLEIILVAGHSTENCLRVIMDAAVAGAPDPATNIWMYPGGSVTLLRSSDKWICTACSAPVMLPGSGPNPNPWPLVALGGDTELESRPP